MTDVVLLSIYLALAVTYKWSKVILASLVSCHVGNPAWAWGSSRERGWRRVELKRKRRGLKGWRKKAALAIWRRFGWTGLQLSPGSALLELAYLAGKDHDISLYGYC